MLAPHDTLHERYQILYVADQQPECIVYRAYDQSAGRQVLIAELPHDDPAALHATEQLAHATVRLSQESPPTGLLPLEAHVASEQTYYVIVADPGGQDLARGVEDTATFADSLLHQSERLLAVLAALHTQQPPLLLGDLHPADLWVAEDRTLWLAPYALLRPVGAGRTPYRAPELEDPAQPPTQASDIYALGAVCYHLLTGGPPPDSTQRMAGTPLAAPHTLRLPVGSLLERVMLRALEINPAERYQHVREMRQALELVRIVEEAGPFVAAAGAAAGSSPSIANTPLTTAAPAQAPASPAGTSSSALPSDSPAAAVPATSDASCLVILLLLLLLLTAGVCVAAFFFFSGPGDLFFSGPPLINPADPANPGSRIFNPA
jgi:hypothetical protein